MFAIAAFLSALPIFGLIAYFLVASIMERPDPEVEARASMRSPVMAELMRENPRGAARSGLRKRPSMRSLSWPSDQAVNGREPTDDNRPSRS